MMRSLYSGISGLRNHQTRMDVIGNNISNVNTAGYKTSRTIFQDIFSQNIQSGMASQPTVGGTNPLQVGLGIRLSTVDVLHTRSAFQRTDQATDMMINGDGFFIVATVNPDTNEFEKMYTRAGNFNIDSDGYLVNSLGYYVLGNAYELTMAVIDPGQAEVLAMQSGVYGDQAGADAPAVPIGSMIPAGSIPIGTNVPAGLFGTDPVTGQLIPPTTGATTQTLPADTMRTRIAWSPVGVNITTQTSNYLPARPPVFGLTSNPAVLAPGTDMNGLNKIRVTSDAYRDLPPFAEMYDALDAAQQAAIDAMMESGNSAAFLTAFPNFFNQFPADYVSLPGFGVNKSGYASVILNNRTVDIGQLAIAMFANPPGLEKAGNSLYRETASSGPVVITEAYLDGAGFIESGGLEMSNVDLASEFTDMIVTQRGFQANSRIITVSDTMLEELVNLKR